MPVSDRILLSIDFDFKILYCMPSIKFKRKKMIQKAYSLPCSAEEIQR